jgi:hypothetical protein
MNHITQAVSGEPMHRLCPNSLALECYLAAGQDFALRLVGNQRRTIEDDLRFELWEAWERDIIRRGYQTRSFEDFKTTSIIRSESVVKRAPDELPVEYAAQFREQHE